MNAEIAFNCDFCGKSGIIMSKAGILYCRWCRMSYGEQPFGTPEFIKSYEKVMKGCEDD